MSKPWLLFYNGASCLGWAYVLLIAVSALLEGSSPQQLWAKVSVPLQIVQTTAILEIVHSAIGMVRSPLLTVLMQVASRVVLLWGYSTISPTAQTHWSLYLMVISWAISEVPRYLFYVLSIIEFVPFPVFYLRYSLFIVLYPTGIFGELAQVWTSIPYFKTHAPAYRIFSYVLLGIYAPCGPFMVMSMFGQRARAFKARLEASKSKESEKKAQNGLVWPVTDPKTGERSTIITNRDILSASVRGVDPGMADKIDKERNWRFGYEKWVVKNVELSCRSADVAVDIARAGLAHAHKTFEFVRDGKSMTFEEAMDGRFGGSFHTAIVRGTKPKPKQFELGVPYKKNVLTGDALLGQLKQWANYGTIEPSARDAIALVASSPNMLDLSDQYFVLLGAGSAMGPLLLLLSLGANIIAIDLDRPQIWQRLIKLAKESCGTMYIPCSKNPDGLSDDELAKVAGGNLFTQPPEIRNWLVDVAPGKPLTIGGYAYLDGALHVQVSLAMDAIMKGVRERRKTPLAVGFLCSPTDVFVIDEETRLAQINAQKEIPLWQKAVSALSFGRALKFSARRPVTSDSGLSHMCATNNIIVQQGPNYALAKRIQHWRAMVHRSEGGLASSNIAPSTATVSVVHNKLFALAYKGFKFFKPMEVFYQETSNAVMGALLIHDVRNPEGVSNPTTALDNPIKLFASGAFHGGMWRTAYAMNSCGETAAIAYLVQAYRWALIGFAGAVFATIRFGLPFDLP